jgi:hypothetical protein
VRRLGSEIGLSCCSAGGGGEGGARGRRGGGSSWFHVLSEIFQ